MPAREKLNSAAIQGVLALAALIALIFQSWPMFWLAAAVMVGAAIYSGDIRLSKRGRRSKR